MSIFHAWLVRYRTILGETRLLSRIGSFTMVVFAIAEAVTVIRGISLAENLSREAVVGAVVSIAVYVLAFGVRLILLFRVPQATVLHAVTWWLVAAGVYFCAEPKSHFYYFTLETTGLLFVVLSSIWFLIAAALVFLRCDDFSSDS